MDCWNQKEYRGFGIAAHSYIDKKRFCNISNIDKYIENIENIVGANDMNKIEDASDINKIKKSDNIEDAEIVKNKLKENIIIQEEQSDDEVMKEYMLLGLRKIKGVSISDFESKFGKNPIMLFKEELNFLVNENLIEIDLDNIRLTNKGLDLANNVWEEFI